MKRRDMLKGVLGGVATTGVTKAMGFCGLGSTPEQPLGPFYPERDQQDKDNDLVYVKGRSAGASGEVIHVTGVVTDENCAPIKGALVEIWQACDTGRYNHSGDPNVGAALDPNFQYWGRDVSKENGQYTFRTIFPGEYPATANWIRPPHIHFKISCRGYKELVTQLYFSGMETNKGDRILQALPETEKQKVVMPLQNVNNQIWVQFNIQLEKI